MRSLCRFKDCATYGMMNAIYVDTDSGKFELEWCRKCGRIQNELR